MPLDHKKHRVSTRLPEQKETGDGENTADNKRLLAVTHVSLHGGLMGLVYNPYCCFDGRDGVHLDMEEAGVVWRVISRSTRTNIVVYM